MAWHKQQHPRQTLQRMGIPVEACGVSSAECLVGV